MKVHNVKLFLAGLALVFFIYDIQYPSIGSMLVGFLFACLLTLSFENDEEKDENGNQ